MKQLSSPLSVLSVAAELTDLQQRLVACKEQLHQQKILNEHLLAENESLKKISAHTSSDFLPLSVDMILKQDTEDKKLFEYYSSLKYDTFVKLLQFLTAEDTPKIQRKRKDILSMTNENQLLLTLIRLRHNFGLKDLAFRFCISQQAVSEIFNAWIDHITDPSGATPESHDINGLGERDNRDIGAPLTVFNRVACKSVMKISGYNCNSYHCLEKSEARSTVWIHSKGHSKW
ncbi:hypothetical protein KUTeg_006312 [Tegillarca granosa]|uniref:Transposase Helix-turn-helix domain-containing protein n=1 Tax=Tegillarca granosa TaxID=220873 RepID=A0ABQ9FG40_TEGGR|nr:hypothetical protein KUTeg_006312 [Tegillarca granosa]